ncbi:hypothetical protein [Belnapia sp. F-4-1]|uniref:hypothetical protein n=1 Tax=Belnapia sp. F-4-1 TaxID=1545443 RepID=UPI0005B882FC|nr:hypothetical protein [Belnapia sp. F-4-1]
MNAPQRSFVFYPMHNQPPDKANPLGNDATGAFQLGAALYEKYFTKLGCDVTMYMFDNHLPAEQRRAQIINALCIGTGGGWYDAIVYFGHGYPDGMPSAGFDLKSIDQLTNAVWACGQYSVKVVLYACSCGVDAGYAWRISEAMKPWAQEGYGVYGHASDGHAFSNAQVRQYPNGGAVTGIKTAPAGKIPAWVKSFADPKSTLWLRFPFMGAEEIAAEL